MARRIYLLNSEIPSFDLRDAAGIVLVDELDLHLHPAWQRQVVSGVRTAVPALQRIFTTHSRQVVSTAPRQCF
ncbi:MAG: AAA family ATPase [Candidatus Nanopelagicales bacterium]